MVTCSLFFQYVKLSILVWSSLLWKIIEFITIFTSCYFVRNNSLSCLDVFITKMVNKFTSDVYGKLTFSGLGMKFWKFCFQWGLLKDFWIITLLLTFELLLSSESAINSPPTSMGNLLFKIGYEVLGVLLIIDINSIQFLAC